MGLRGGGGRGEGASKMREGRGVEERGRGRWKGMLDFLSSWLHADTFQK